MPSAVNQSVEVSVSKSGESLTLLQEKFTGRLTEAMKKQENLMTHFDVQDVTETDRVSEKFMGDTQLEVLAPGQAPNGQPVDFDKNVLVVDAVVIGRNYVRKLSEVQGDIAGLNSKLSNQQGQAHKKMEDKMLAQQLVYAGIENTKAKRTNPRVSGMGFSQDTKIKDTILADPEGLMAAIEATLERMLTGEEGGSDGVDLNNLVILMKWSDFNCLRDAERICNSQYNTFQGTTVSGFTLKSYNIPVVPTNRLPNKAETSLLSKPSNGNRYDSTAEQAKVRAVIFGTEALMVGRSVALETEIWRDPNTKSWVIDSLQSEGAIPSVWEQVAVIRGDTAGNTTADNGLTNDQIVARANRKAVRTKAALTAA